MCTHTGVQDENSSRGKMVQTYLRQADSVWLVSNIRRAVNDKSTKVRSCGDRKAYVK